MSACPRCGMMPTVTFDYHLGTCVGARAGVKEDR